MTRLSEPVMRRSPVAPSMRFIADGVFTRLITDGVLMRRIGSDCVSTLISGDGVSARGGFGESVTDPPSAAG
jgi:hypothetical protein